MIKKANSAPADKVLRRRRKPEAAEYEILSAAENFLRESPLRDMTIDDIMSRTGLSRPSFYEYFRDRNQLVIKLAERVSGRHAAICAIWLRSEQPIEALRDMMREFAEFFAREGHLMRALIDAANNDRDVEDAYRRALQMGIDGAAEKIRADAESGLINLEGFDAQDLAGALIATTNNYFIEKLGRRPQAEPATVAETLIGIWMRVLYSPAR